MSNPQFIYIPALIDHWSAACRDGQFRWRWFHPEGSAQTDPSHPGQVIIKLDAVISA